MIWLPESADVLQIHSELVTLFASDGDPIEPAGLRDMNLLESACLRPRTSLGGTDKYETLNQKSAALFHSLVKNHPFHNGNKRAALATLLTTLARNDRRFIVTIGDDDVYDMVVAVTADSFANPEYGTDADHVVTQLSWWLQYRTIARRAKPSPMSTRDFLESCAAAGANVKKSGPSHVVSFKKSVRFSQSTTELSGSIVRQYLREIGLTETRSGISIDEFQDGIFNDRGEINRFVAVLRRLAHT